MAKLNSFAEMFSLREGIDNHFGEVSLAHYGVLFLDEIDNKFDLNKEKMQEIKSLVSNFKMFMMKYTNAIF